MEREEIINVCRPIADDVLTKVTADVMNKLTQLTEYSESKKLNLLCYTMCRIGMSLLFGSIRLEKERRGLIGEKELKDAIISDLIKFKVVEEKAH